MHFQITIHYPVCLYSVCMSFMFMCLVLFLLLFFPVHISLAFMFFVFGTAHTYMHAWLIAMTEKMTLNNSRITFSPLGC